MIIYYKKINVLLYHMLCYTYKPHNYCFMRMTQVSNVLKNVTGMIKSYHITDFISFEF